MDGDLAYFPCAVQLRDGSVIERVYLVAEAPFLATWGIAPSQDPGKTEVLIADVNALQDSPYRLPPRMANRIYEAGESGMGYVVFTVVFKDASRQAYLTGNAVDFIEYPYGKGPEDVESVLPHDGRHSGYRHGLNYAWCLYAE